MSHSVVSPPLDETPGLAHGWSLALRGCVFCLLVCLFGWFLVWLGCWFGKFAFLFILSPSYKSFEAQDGLSKMDTRPDA